MIGLELWPVGDKQTDKQTNGHRITKSTDRYTFKKQTGRQGWKHNFLLPSVAKVITKTTGSALGRAHTSCLVLSFVIPVNKMNLKSLPLLNHIPYKSKELYLLHHDFKKFICPSLSITFFKMRFPPVYSYYITNFELRLSDINLFFMF